MKNFIKFFKLKFIMNIISINILWHLRIMLILFMILPSYSASPSFFPHWCHSWSLSNCSNFSCLTWVFSSFLLSIRSVHCYIPLLSVYSIPEIVLISPYKLFNSHYSKRLHTVTPTLHRKKLRFKLMRCYRRMQVE